MADKLLTDIDGAVDKHLLPDGSYDITGLLQDQRDLTTSILQAGKGALNELEITHAPSKETRQEIEKIRERYSTIPIEAERLDRPRIICLCGSTRFIREFSEYYAKLTDEGCIVLTVGRVVPQHEQHLERKRKLDELHLRKIDLADEVFVINVCGYIGESTSNEIAYAKKLGKPIKYLEEVD